MSWTWDSGLVAPIRSLVRNAVISLLGPLQQPTGPFEAVIPIGFAVKAHDDHSIDLLYQELNGRAPAVAVFLGDAKYDPAGAPDRSRGTLAVDVFVISSHRRGVTDGRIAADAAAAAANTADPGLDVSLELVWQFLFNADLGIGPRANPLKLRHEEELIVDDEKTVWHQAWECLVTRDVNLNRSIVQKLTTLHTTLHPLSDQPGLSDQPASLDMVEDTTVG